MIVHGFWDQHGRAAQGWNRSFYFPKPRRFDATMTFDPELNRVVEWLRPWNLFEVVWEVVFEPPDTIRIVAERVRVGWRTRRWTLPAWASPHVQAVERAVGDSHIWIDLLVGNRIMGDIFGYEGRFHVRREPKPTLPGARRR